MKKSKLYIAVAGSALFLAGCTVNPSITEQRGELTGHVVQIIDTGVDSGGGPRMQIVSLVDGQTKDVLFQISAAGTGTLQSSVPTIGGIGQAAVQGYFFKEGMRELRPAEFYSNTETETNVNSGAVAGGGEGGTAFGGEASATGGEGGVGGQGGVGGEAIAHGGSSVSDSTGGNATGGSSVSDATGGTSLSNSNATGGQGGKGGSSVAVSDSTSKGGNATGGTSVSGSTSSSDANSGSVSGSTSSAQNDNTNVNSNINKSNTNVDQVSNGGNGVPNCTGGFWNASAGKCVGGN